MKSGGKAKLDKHTEHEGPDEEEYQNDLESEEGASTDEEDQNEKFHYIITEHDERRSDRREIPQVIKLKDPLPKENPFMHKRAYPAALRFHKVKEEYNPYKYYLSELMAYIPF